MTDLKVGSVINGGLPPFKPVSPPSNTDEVVEVSSELSPNFRGDFGFEVGSTSNGAVVGMGVLDTRVSIRLIEEQEPSPSTSNSSLP